MEEVVTQASLLAVLLLISLTLFRFGLPLSFCHLLCLLRWCRDGRSEYEVEDLQSEVRDGTKSTA